KNLDKVYDYSGWDKSPIFPGDKEADPVNHPGLEKAFEKQFVYPKGYRYKSNDTSHAMVQVFVDIDNNGKATLDSCVFLFWDSRTKEQDFNKSSWRIMEKTFKSLIEETRWTPAKIKSFAVKSNNEFFIRFK